MALDHRTDPRTMYDRWQDMGWSVKWSDDARKYVVVPARRMLAGEAFFTAECPDVDSVEVFVLGGQP